MQIRGRDKVGFFHAFINEAETGRVMGVGEEDQRPGFKGLIGRMEIESGVFLQVEILRQKMLFSQFSNLPFKVTKVTDGYLACDPTQWFNQIRQHLIILLVKTGSIDYTFSFIKKNKTRENSKFQLLHPSATFRVN
jgi:hypothetical protein